MQPIPYLFFQGQAQEAIRAYARIFGSPEPEVMLASETSEAMPGAEPTDVMHSALQVGSGKIYASDDRGADAMAGTRICVVLPDAAEGRRVFDALAEGGTVELAFTPTFWSPGFGQLTDRWGTRWFIDTEADGAASQHMPEAASMAPPDGQGGTVA